MFAGGIAVANKPINRFAVELKSENKSVADVSRFVTNFGGLYEVYTLAGLFTYGVIFKNGKRKNYNVARKHKHT